MGGNTQKIFQGNWLKNWSVNLNCITKNMQTPKKKKQKKKNKQKNKQTKQTKNVNAVPVPYEKHRQ
jgi:hypothetical protein